VKSTRLQLELSNGVKAFIVSEPLFFFLIETIDAKLFTAAMYAFRKEGKKNLLTKPTCLDIREHAAPSSSHTPALPELIKNTEYKK